tara:strand:- start:575 stop:1057 length:483 start_codon:yes stop_codon:yes gene_type:complete
MNSKNKKILAWGLVVSLIVASVTIFKSNEPIEEVVIEFETTEQQEPTQVEILTSNVEEEVVVEENVLKDVIEEEILHFTDDGILIAPYPDYESFDEAFTFGKGMLGDSAEHGSLRVFMWRGERYNTETLKQPEVEVEIEVEVEVIETVEPDTTVKDSTNN